MPRQKAFGILIYTIYVSTISFFVNLHAQKNSNFIYTKNLYGNHCLNTVVHQYIYIYYIYRADVFFFEQWSSCNICTIINIPNLSQVPPCKLKQECFCVKLTYFDIYMHGMYMHVPTIWTHTWHQPHYAAGASVALHQPHYDAGAMLMLLTLNLLTHTRC